MIRKEEEENIQIIEKKIKKYIIFIKKRGVMIQNVCR